MKEPKFKKGDFVKHILTQEKMLITHVRVYSLMYEKTGEFCGEYNVILKDYSERIFPKWQLKINL